MDAGGPGPSPAHEAHAQLSKPLLLLMATAVAITVANIYYCQPLLGAIARSFSLRQWQAARVPMLTQIGYAMGLGLFVPLGDMLERRALICSLLFATAAALLGVALATSTITLLACSLLLGMFAAVVQVIVPMAVSLAPPAQRGRAVGAVFIGITIGVMTSRTISGFAGSYFGWRVVYAGASGTVALLAVLLTFSLPFDQPSPVVSYTELMKSVFVLVRQCAPLREAAFYGGCCFASLNAFWSTLVFFIGRPPYHYGEGMAGALGLVGIGAAAIVPAVGRSADRRGPSFAIGIALIAGCSASLILLLWGQWMEGLVAGLMLMTMAVRANQVSNEIAIYAALPEAASRANAVYMVTVFAGSALGTLIASWTWAERGWTGVSLTGELFFSVALVAYLYHRRLRNRDESSTSVQVMAQ